MPAGQRLEAAQVKHDISVPVARLREFVETVRPCLDDILPGVRANAFGHLGDGNIHFNLSPPISQPDFGPHKAALSQDIYQFAESIGGSFAAEHGLERTKIRYADHLRSVEERDVIRALKEAFDR